MNFFGFVLTIALLIFMLVGETPLYNKLFEIAHLKADAELTKLKDTKNDI